MDEKKTLTPAELYAEGADHHQGLTGGRATDLLDIITAVSAALGEAQPPRLDWLKRLADGARPKT